MSTSHGGTDGETFALFAGGGTGGHVVPAMAVAAELVARGHAQGSIHFVGSERGVETTMVPAAGYGLTALPGRGVPRRISVASLKAVLGIVAGVVHGVGVVRRLRPRVVVAYGGYASVPGIVGAVIWRVPLVVMARDAVGGAADRLGGRFAKACAVPFEGSDLPRAVVTGNPVRDDIGAIDRAVDRDPARRALDLASDRVVVGVFTGSLGSRTVNQAVRGLLDRWANRSDVSIRHAVGRRDWDEFRASLPALPADGLQYQPLEYEDHMAQLLAAADVAVTHGGATVAELAAVGLPAVLVPLPIAPRDHQWLNGQQLVDAGAAVMVRDRDFDTDRLERELTTLIDDGDRRARMAAGAKALRHPDAAARVADLVERHYAVSRADDPHTTAADDDVDVDLGRPRRIHVVGAGGAAMNAIATVLAAMGHRVSGSDQAESAGLDRLRALGVAVAVGHDADLVGADVELVTVSTAIPATNPEIVAARSRGIPVASRSHLMVAIAAAPRQTVAVAGTHGKTTTSSMLAVILADAGWDPSFVIGGELRRFGGGAAWSGGALLVAEADESDGMFLDLPRHAAVVTNVEPDHLEHYGGDFARLQAAFEAFLVAAPGPKVVGADDPVAAALGRSVGARTVGTDADADYRLLVHERRGPGPGVDFSVVRDGESIAEVRLPMSGLYNARNAGAALAMAVELGVPPAEAAAALDGFSGVARRFERPRGEADGITFIDDYAHLPTEVADAVGAGRDGGWRRLVCVFQPHRYSRIAALWRDFADAFEGADLLVVTDIYPAGEQPRPGVTGMLVVDAVLDAHPWHRVAYLPTIEDASRYLGSELRAGDLCLTLGAGDLTTLPDLVQARLADRS